MSDMDRIRLHRLEANSREFAARLAYLEARVADAPARAADPQFVASVAVDGPSARLEALPHPTAASVADDIAAAAGAARAEFKAVLGTPRERRRTRRELAFERGTSFEDLVAGRVLAWGGAITVLVGIVLLFAIAISRGWIGEGARTLLGAAMSATLVAVGSWAYERRGRTDASLAATATGLAGLFVTVVVAARVYESIPVGLGVLLGLLNGVLSTSIALHRREPAVAAIGIVGGLLAPVMVGAPHDGPTIALLFTAALAAAAVCVRERWDWLGLTACAVVTPQWVGYLMTDVTSAATLMTLIGFGVAAAAGAVGFELRGPTTAVRPVSVLLLVLNAFLLAAVGWLALDSSELWLVALAAVHVATGATLLRHPRASRPVGILAGALGVVIADLAMMQMLDGPALTIGWAVVTVGFAALVRFVGARGSALDKAATGAGLAAHVALALLNAVMAGAPPEAILARDGAGVAASGALAALAAACMTSGFVLSDRPGWRSLLNGLGLAATTYLMAVNLDGLLLVGAWTAEALALAELARRRHDSFALRAGIAHLALACAHALVFEAPPFGLVAGLDRPLTAALAVGACIAAAWRVAAAAATFPSAAASATDADEAVARQRGDAVGAVALPLAVAGALLGLYLVSIELVTVAGAGAQAQTLLSVLWGAVGVVALLTGLLRDVAPLRTGALWLLLAALAKVFLYDLAALTPVARVISFVVLGALLLLGAFAWQRIRPRPLPDLRDAVGAAHR